MLIVARKKNQRLVIGHKIIVTVLSIRKNQVRLGIEAPPEVTVHRQEVEEAIKREENHE